MTNLYGQPRGKINSYCRKKTYIDITKQETATHEDTDDCQTNVPSVNFLFGFPPTSLNLINSIFEGDLKIFLQLIIYKCQQQIVTYYILGKGTTDN